MQFSILVFVALASALPQFGYGFGERPGFGQAIGGLATDVSSGVGTGVGGVIGGGIGGFVGGTVNGLLGGLTGGVLRTAEVPAEEKN